MRISLQPAFILHHRPYRETSVLLELFTPEHGRISAIAKGVRQQRSKLKSLLQPFVPLFVSCQGKSELLNLNTAEPNGNYRRLKGECLFSGLYLNELLVRVLPKCDPHPKLYTIYHGTLLELQRLSSTREISPAKCLRMFEKNLLEELGYGLQFNFHSANQASICAEKFYRFDPELGFELCAPDALTVQATIFSGKSLLAFAAEELHDDECLQDAKRLMRLALGPLIGPVHLHSRRMYTKYSVEKKVLEVEVELGE